MLDGLDEFCERALTEHACPSVSVAVVQGDEVVFARAYGLADVAANRAATPETVYGLASITKAFTATAVCLAADRKLLDLDAPVPGGDPWPPTPRQLMQHRGGFPSYYDFHYDADSPIDFSAYRRQLQAPGGEFEYSNHGYRELGRLLEQATGQPLRTFLHEQVARPLGLTSFDLGPTYAGPAPAASRYTPDGRVYPTCYDSHPSAGAGWASATDIALFARRSAGLLHPATAAAVLDGPAINDRLGYGFGRVVQRGDGSSIVSHGGGMGGVGTMMIDLPERELSLAVLANCTDKSARNAVVLHLMDTLAPEFDPGHLAPDSDPTRAFALAPGSWAGLIESPDGGIPLRLDVLADRRVVVHLADLPLATVPATASRRWDVRLVADLQLPTADARLNSPSFGLELHADGDALTGRAGAFKDGDREGLLGPYLLHPCRLLRG
ncbi:serine hydrolase domain-containing protein [Kitasatospora sp. CB01950]|uniref:serine hydrolase domain-containing protein n=1 Tax=Kitasatospora sp. CB01950 TaxID=1703930 RepID=UPI00093F0271|nr:serine hydrolase domain-containing protein [Kitasatospora sp. CB01950]OKI99128.1 hypothetical protein AMK19_31555 [Kitasatospora sp. CB01950]